ncbi:MAG: YncE family protein, partial [Armatimonadota bacterium]
MRRSVVGLLVICSLVASPAFASLPSVTEAEKAELGKGVVIVRHPNASGGAFVEAQTTATLQFTVNAPKPMQVRIIPKFWRNSVKTPPRFFPYPLPTLFGPDAVVALGSRIYFTAPTSGQIGIMDAQSGEIIGNIQIGGYLTDIVADEKTQRLFTADAWNGRIVAVDTATNRIVAQAKVPQVWSLDLHNGKLFAASRHQRQLFVLDAATLKTLQTIALPASPIHVAVSPTTIIVRFEPFVLLLPDFVPMPADRIDYGFGQRTTAEFGPRNQVGWKRFTTAPQGLRLTVRTEKGDESRIISLPQNATPVALATLGNRLFVATDKGLLVILDMAAETPVATLQITDRAFDVVAAFGKVYATDSAQNRVLVVDAGKGQVVKVIAVPDEPVALEAYEPRWWTQDFAPQPLLFVACRKAKTIAVISPTDEKLLRIVPLPFEPASVRFVLPPDPSWWPLIPADRIAFELTPRLAVAPKPITLDAKTLSKT